METPLRVDRGGRFREHRGLDTQTRTFDVDFVGRLGRRGASGTFQTTDHTKMGDALTCQTSLVHWTARRVG